MPLCVLPVATTKFLQVTGLCQPLPCLSSGQSLRNLFRTPIQALDSGVYFGVLWLLTRCRDWKWRGLRERRRKNVFSANSTKFSLSHLQKLFGTYIINVFSHIACIFPLSVPLARERGRIWARLETQSFKVCKI